MPAKLPAVVEALTLGFVNVYFVGKPGGSWALIDTGMPFHFSAIVRAAERRYGKGTRPAAIYLTHGHADHVGSARALAAYWNVPIYAHPAELPYVEGRSDYPPGDPSVGGPAVVLARLAPTRGVDLRPFIQPMTSAPDGWTALELPGHTPGSVGFWHAESKTLIAGDALTTMRLASWKGLLRTSAQLNRPPEAFTTDWVAVRHSIRSLVELRPEILLCGHGKPLCTPELPGQLAHFAEFMLPPLKGRYTAAPVRYTESGQPIVAPRPPDPAAKALKLAALTALVGTVAYCLAQRGERDS